MNINEQIIRILREHSCLYPRGIKKENKRNLLIKSIFIILSDVRVYEPYISV